MISHSRLRRRAGSITPLGLAARFAVAGGELSGCIADAANVGVGAATGDAAKPGTSNNPPGVTSTPLPLSIMPGGMPGGMPGQAPGGITGTAPGGAPGGTTGQAPGGTTGPAQGGMGGVGGILGGGTVSSQVAAMLEQDADRYTWVAATVASQSAAGLQLATQHSVMPIGGFNGSDPSPTLAQFQQWVSEGKIHYFLGGSGAGGMRQMGGSNNSSEIAAWVAQNFTSRTVDGVTLYDLTAGGDATSTT